MTKQTLWTWIMELRNQISMLPNELPLKANLEERETLLCVQYVESYGELP